VRIALTILVAALAITVAGAAWACEATKTASASAGSSCSSKAKAAVASAEADCDYCDFVAELKAAKKQVTISTVEDKNGVTVVFAAVADKDVEAAQLVASKAYSLMSKPAHCNYSRAQLTEASCDGCKKGIGAFADAKVTFEETENGAWAKVATKDEKAVKTLHAFFSELQPEEDVEG
jgi:hypothetical protein